MENNKQNKEKTGKSILFLSCIMFAVSFLVIGGSVSAAGVKYVGIDADISENLVVSKKITITIEEDAKRLEIMLDSHVVSLESDSQGGTHKCSYENSVRGSVLTCDVYGHKDSPATLKLHVSTRGDVKKTGEYYTFDNNFKLNDDADKVFMLVRLPSSGVITENGGDSFLPPDGKVITDGKRIMVSWTRNNVTEDLGVSFSASFEVLGAAGDMWNVSFGILTVLVVLVMVGTGLYVKRAMAPKEAKVEVLPLLNKAEKKIVDIIARNGGDVRQKVIVKDSDYSKAKVSRIIKSLEERGVIETEAISGREKRIVLKIKGIKVSEPEENSEM